jgi:hypothetical protein
MGQHARSGHLFRHKYPVIAAAAVLAVAGAASVLVARGTPATAARAGSEAPAAASSPASVIYGCAEYGGGFSSVPVTAAAACPPDAYAASRLVQLRPPIRTSVRTANRTDNRAVTHKATPKASPTQTSTSSSSGSRQFFGLAPLGTSLPRSDAYCASHVLPMAENVPGNASANQDVPPAGTNFDWGPSTQTGAGLKANFADVDGDFSGTTGEILEWAACKWGWNQDYAFAEAVVESVWNQAEVSGNSYGILQVSVSQDGDPPSANSGWGGYPWVQESTAVDADAQMAYLRACYDGDTPWLGNGYQAGDAWGCIGSWFSGDWDSSAAESYISSVQQQLNSQSWLNL